MPITDATIGLAESTGDRGVPAFAVRKDSAADLAGASGSYAPLQMDSTGNLRVTGSLTTTPSGTQDVNLIQAGGNTLLVGNGVTGTGSPRVTIASDNTAFTVNAAQSGTWNIGTVTTLTGGTVTANAGTNLNTSLLALESGGNLATLAGAVTASVVQANVKQVNGITVLMGNGVTGTGSQRVTIASDNTAFSVNAVQSGTWNIGTITTLTGGTVTANAGTNLNTSLLALESGGNLATLAGAITASVAQANVKQINGTTVLMGNGVTGTGSQRVTIASDNTAFSVNATPVTQADTFMLGGVNIKEINAVAPLMGNGITGTGSQRVTIASDNTAFSVNAIQSGTWNIGTVTTVSTDTNLSQMNGVAITMGNGISGTGVQRVTIASDSTGQIALATGSSTIGSVIKVPSATSTALTLNRQTALSNTAVAIKTSSGRLHGIHFYNSGTSDAFVQFYDVAQGSVTVGTTTPNWTWAVPAGGVIDSAFPDPFPAATAITMAATSTVTGGSAPGTALLAQFAYI